LRNVDGDLDAEQAVAVAVEDVIEAAAESLTGLGRRGDRRRSRPAALGFTDFGAQRLGGLQLVSGRERRRPC
jgi:hypothetical protein